MQDRERQSELDKISFVLSFMHSLKYEFKDIWIGKKFSSGKKEYFVSRHDTRFIIVSRKNLIDFFDNLRINYKEFTNKQIIKILIEIKHNIKQIERGK